MTLCTVDFPKDAAAQPVRFELRQGMTEATCTKHPEPGEPIRRVITGGFGYTKKASVRASEWSMTTATGRDTIRPTGRPRPG